MSNFQGPIQPPSDQVDLFNSIVDTNNEAQEELTRLLKLDGSYFLEDHNIPVSQRIQDLNSIIRTCNGQIRNIMVPVKAHDPFDFAEQPRARREFSVTI